MKLGILADDLTGSCDAAAHLLPPCGSFSPGRMMRARLKALWPRP